MTLGPSDPASTTRGSQHTRLRTMHVWQDQVDWLTPRVPAGRLRRRGRYIEYLCRATCGGSLDVEVRTASAARATNRADAYPDSARPDRGERRAANPRGRPGDGRRAAPAPTSLHTHTWYANLRGPPGQDAVRRPARGHRAQPGAAAPVEGRAARRRLRPLARGPSAPRWRPPTRSSRCPAACAATCSPSTRRSTRTASP